MEVEKLGEGYSRENYEELPVEIPCGKLLDWILERKLIPPKWHKELALVRDQIARLKVDLPESAELEELLSRSGNRIDLPVCEQIVQFLIKTEGDLTLFRQYKSQRLLAWIQVQKSLQKDGLYLAEAAAGIQKLVLYDIPANKKQIQHLQQQASDCEKKDADLATSAVGLRARYSAQCSEMKIQGKDVRQELAQVVRDLPELFGEVVKEVQSSEFKNALEFFNAFLKFLDPESSEIALGLLNFLHLNGNVTPAYYLTGQGPRYPAQGAADLSVVQEAPLPAADEAADIDWDIDLTSTGTEVAGDNGISLEAGDEGTEIDWDVQIVSSDQGISLEPTEIQVISEPSQTLGILEDTDLRNIFLDDLFELHAFFNQRLAEMKGKTDVVSTNMFQMAPEVIQKQTVESVQGHLRAIDQCISRLSNSRIRHLILLKSSPKYLDRLATLITQSLTFADRAEQRRLGVQAKKDTLLAQQQEVQDKTRALLTESKGLQKRVEDWLSQSLHRVVRVIG